MIKNIFFIEKKLLNYNFQLMVIVLSQLNNNSTKYKLKHCIGSYRILNEIALEKMFPAVEIHPENLPIWNPHGLPMRV